MSGGDRKIMVMTPATKGPNPSQRHRLRHSKHQSIPAIMPAKTNAGTEGVNIVAQGLAETPWAIISNSVSACCVSHQKGAPSPTRSSSNASASSGITTKVVSGIATILAKAPNMPAL